MDTVNVYIGVSELRATNEEETEAKLLYNPGRLCFSLVSSPEDGFKMVKEFSPCRDYINDCVIQSHYKDSPKVKKASGYMKQWKGIDADESTLRLLVCKDQKEDIKTAEKRFKDALKVINLYENFAKWKTKSTLSRVKFVNNKYKNVNIDGCWLLTGPKEWMKSTHLISMVTLIVRVVYRNPIFSKCRSIKSIERCFALLCSKSSPGTWTDLGDYLPKCWPKFRMLMKDYDKVFGDLSFEDCNPLDMCFEWHDKGGIVSLCSYITKVPELDKRVREVWTKKYNKRFRSL